MGGGEGGVNVSVLVPLGGEDVFRVVAPSGSQVVVPLPPGTRAGDTVAFELSAGQLAELPASDVEALGEGRFLVEAGDGE